MNGLKQKMYKVQKGCSGFVNHKSGGIQAKYVLGTGAQFQVHKNPYYDEDFGPVIGCGTSPGVTTRVTTFTKTF